MIIVNVKIKPKANCKQDFINAFNNVAELVRQEDGCLEYELHQKLTSDSELFLFERWESKPALDKHLNAEHMIEYIVFSNWYFVENDVFAYLLNFVFP